MRPRFRSRYRQPAQRSDEPFSQTLKQKACKHEFETVYGGKGKLEDYCPKCKLTLDVR